MSMMLLYSFGMKEESTVVEEAVRNVIEAGVKTRDIGGTAGTREVGDAVAKELEVLLGER